MTSCDSVLLTRLEGLKQLSRQLRDNRGQIGELLRESHGRTLDGVLKALSDADTLSPLRPSADGVHSVLVKLLLSLLQLCKLAVHQPGGADILGRRTSRSKVAPPPPPHAHLPVFPQRPWAAVWENWDLWSSPPSPCFTAGTPSTRGPPASSPPPSRGSSTWRSDARTTRSPSPGGVACLRPESAGLLLRCRSRSCSEADHVID